MRKRLLIGTGIALLLLFAYFAWQIAVPPDPILVSPQTTVITAPLADDGLPNYSAYLLGKMKEGVTPENNGAIPFLEALWPAEVPLEGQAPLCKELGMQIPAKDGMQAPYQNKQLCRELLEYYKQELGIESHDKDADTEAATPALPDEWGYTDPESKLADLKDWIEIDLLTDLEHQPWSAAEIPPLAKWVDDHSHQYDLLHQAAAKDHFYLPPTDVLTNPEIPFLYIFDRSLMAMRTAVRCLLVRGFMRLGAGDEAGAWDDCRVIYRLARRAPSYSAISRLVALSCEAYAHSLATAILASDNLTPDLAKQIHAFLKSLPPPASMAETIDEHERLLFVTGVLNLAGVRKSNSPNPGDLRDSFGPLGPLSHLAMDWNTMLTLGNEWYDKLAAVYELPYEERNAAINTLQQELNKAGTPTVGTVVNSALSRDARSRHVTNTLTDLLIPGYTELAEGTDQNAERLQVEQVVAALAVHRTTHGSYPDALTDLVPTHFDTVPIDVFGTPLAYRRTSDGYLLYSLGADGIDDNGSHHGWLMEGYEVPRTEAEDDLLRAALGEPPRPEPEVTEESEEELDGDKSLSASPSADLLTPPENSDDIAIRLPLLQRPLPKFEPTSD